MQHWPLACLPPDQCFMFLLLKYGFVGSQNVCEQTEFEMSHALALELSGKYEVTESVTLAFVCKPQQVANQAFGNLVPRTSSLYLGFRV